MAIRRRLTQLTFGGSRKRPLLLEDCLTLDVPWATDWALGNNNSEVPWDTPNLTVVDAPGRPGEKAFKVRVVNADWVYQNDRPAPFGQDRQRAEIVRVASAYEWEQGPEFHYAVSVLVPVGFVYTNNDGAGRFLNFMQFHDAELGHGYQPMVALRYRNNGAGLIQLRVESGLEGQGDSRVPLDGTIQQGVWQDVRLHIRWSNASDGFVKYYLNGTLVGTNNARNVYLEQGNLPVHHRVGLYRGTGLSATQEYHLNRVRVGLTEASLRLR